jgi:hypothetical protein
MAHGMGGSRLGLVLGALVALGVPSLAAAEGPQPAPAVAGKAAPGLPKAAAKLPGQVDALRASLTSALRSPKAAAARRRFVQALDSTLTKVAQATKATSLEQRLAAYRSALETFLLGYQAMCDDPATQAHRTELGRAVDEARSRLSANDPLLTALEALAATMRAKERGQEMADAAKRAQGPIQSGTGIIGEIVRIVVSMVVTTYTFGQSDGASRVAVTSSVPAGRLDRKAVDSWSAAERAAFAKALERVRSSPSSSKVADARLVASANGLGSLATELKLALEPEGE